MATKQTWAEKWGQSSPDYTMGKEPMSKLLKKVRSATARRTASLSKNKSYSYASHQFNQSIKKTYMSGKLPPIENMSYKQMERELRFHHQFWSSKTSTSSGARKEQLEQSRRIFGTDKKGKPIRVMTLEESRAFWSAYEEFYNMYKDSTARFDSTRIQQAIGSTMSMLGGFVEPDSDLVKILSEAMEKLKYQSELEEQGYDFQNFDPNSPSKAFNPNELTPRSQRKIKEVYRGDGNALK